MSADILNLKAALGIQVVPSRITKQKGPWLLSLKHIPALNHLLPDMNQREKNFKLTDVTILGGFLSLAVEPKLN